MARCPPGGPISGPDECMFRCPGMCMGSGTGGGTIESAPGRAGVIMGMLQGEWAEETLAEAMGPGGVG